MKKLPGFKIYFEVLIKFYRFTNICDLKFLDIETMTLWIFFEICREKRFAFTFGQMREIWKPQFCWYFSDVLLWVTLMEMKVSQVGCFQITGRWICCCIFSDIWFIVFFTRSLWKKFMKKLSFSSSNFKNPSQDVVYYKKIKISNFVILKWWPFECKKSHFGGCFFRNEKCWHF